MKLKRMLAALLALAAVFTLAAAPAQASSFPDVTDPAMARAVSTLQSLGIVNGMEDGTFQPNSALTRVQFCKMAIEIMGRGDEAKAQMSRTIFTDVTSTHWGRGYVNLAATMKLGDGSNARLMMGTGSGRFEPDRDISYQEAVTLILRMLGYNDDANRAWPVGALQLSVEMGLRFLWRKQERESQLVEGRRRGCSHRRNLPPRYGKSGGNLRHDEDGSHHEAPLRERGLRVAPPDA